MTSTQKFLQVILPKFLFEALRNGTRNWVIECPCGYLRDLWDAGGIKGEGNQESTYKKCYQCGQRHWHKKRKKTPEEFNRFPKYPEKTADGSLLFRPRKDTWAMLLVWGSATVIWLSGYVVSIMVQSTTEVLIVTVLAVAGGLIAPWFWFTMEYRLTATSLRLQCGCFKKRLPYSSIVDVRPKYAGIGISYAFSLDTLKIETVESRLGYRIAPEDRKGFLIALAEQCPHLRLHAGKLTAS